MKRKLASAPSAKELRQRAEAALVARPKSLGHKSATDVKKLVHDLQVHQVELEMQNDELRRDPGGLGRGARPLLGPLRFRAAAPCSP